MTSIYFILVLFFTAILSCCANAQVQCPFGFEATLSLTDTMRYNFSSSNYSMAIASVALVKYTEHYIRPYSRCKDMPSKWPHHCMVLLPIDPDHPHTPGVIQRINSEYHSIVMYYSPGALPPIDPEMHLFEFTPQDSPHLPLTQFGGKAASTSAPYTCPGLDPNDEASLRLFRYGFVPFDIQRTRNFVTNIVVGRELGQELYNRVIANTTSQLSFGLSYDRDLPNVTFVYEEDIKWPDGWYMAREGDALGRVFSGLLGGGIAACIVLICLCGIYFDRRAKKREQQRRLQEQEQQQGEILLSETPNMARRIAQQRRRGHLERPIRRGLDDLSHLDVMAYAEYVVLCGDATNISKAADCAICIEHFENENEVRVLPCLHPFHLRCIDPWLTAHSAACPLCKQEARSKGS